MSEYIYTVGELKNIIKESSKQVSPKLGNNVSNDNIKNNNDYYKETTKKIKEYNSNLPKNNENKKLPPKMDGNKTTLDSSFSVNPDKSYKDRIKAQAKGYTSTYEENNNIEKNGEFDENSKIYDNLKDAHDEMAKITLANKKSGLAAREMPSSTFEKESMYENRKTKRLYFKHTKFLGESHMLSRIPEEYKLNGQRIIMKDCDDNEYMVEWVIDNDKNISEGKIIWHENKKAINEEMNRIKNLMAYKSSDYFKNTTAESRSEENENVGKYINEARKIINND